MYAWFNRGNAFIELKEYNEAIKWYNNNYFYFLIFNSYDESLKIEPTYYAWLNRGLAFGYL